MKLILILLVITLNLDTLKKDTTYKKVEVKQEVPHDKPITYIATIVGFIGCIILLNHLKIWKEN